jgi:signal transduction histidine kinase
MYDARTVILGAFSLSLARDVSGQAQQQAPVSLDMRLVVIGALMFLIFVALLARQFLARWRKREAEREALDRNTKQLQLVLSTSGCELWEIDLQLGRIMRYNEIASIGLRSPKHGVSVARFMEHIYPEDQASFQNAFEAYQRGETEEFEAYYRVHASSGELRWLRSRGRTLNQNKTSGTTVDVTEIKRGEQALQQLNATLAKQLAELEQARADLVEVEKRRKLALWGSGCEFFQADVLADTIQRENLLPGLAVNSKASSLSGFWKYLHPDDLEQFNVAFVDHAKGRTDFFDVTYRAMHEDGHWVWIQTRSRAVARDANGKVYLLAGTNYDVSDLKRTEFQLSQFAATLEQRVKERTRDLSHALDDLKRAQRKLVDTEKMAALGALVAGVAHEINTPLGIGVTAASHLAEQAQQLQRQLADNQLSRGALHTFAETAQQSSDLVLSHLRRASELVRSFKQVAVDQSSEQQRSIELHSYLEDILSSLRPSLKKSKLAIRIDCPKALHCYTYPGAIYQIISNLVLNAVHHAFATHEGVIVISARADATLLTLSVEDNGAGIAPELRKRVFEPFFTTKRGQGGSGLGLHIVFNLVTQVLHGTIAVSSNTPHGARFVIEVPRHSEPDTAR